MNGLAAAQYLSYLLAGALYYLVFGAIAGVSARFGLVGLFVLFVPLLLGGYVSGLSFFMPRVAATAALVMAAPLLLLGIADFFRGNIAANLLFVIAPALVIAVSIIVLLWTEQNRPVWRRLVTRFDKLEIGFFAALPALFATWSLLSLCWWLFSHSWRRAT